MDNITLKHALKYLTEGRAVFPLYSVVDGVCECGDLACHSPGKHPRAKNGLKEATSVQEHVLAYADAWRQSNIAIRTGQVSNLVVIDVDPRHGGMVSWAKLVEKHGPFPDTRTVKTGGGGFHFFYKYPAGVSAVRNRAGVLPGLDVRGDDGYIVAVPSLHVSGSRYEYVGTGDEPVAELPQVLFDLIVKKDQSPRPAGATEQSDGAPTAPAAPSTLFMGTVREGGRHNHLVQKAAQLQRYIRGTALEVALLGENEATCVPPLPAKEVKRIAEDYSCKESLPQLLSAPRTDLGNAERLIESYGHLLARVPELEQWFCWDGRRWRPDSDGAVLRFAEQMARRLYTAAETLSDEKERASMKKYARTCEKKNKVNAMVEVAAHQVAVLREIGAFDQAPMLLNVANGTVDLRTGELRPHGREDLITKVTEMAYNPLATCPLWLKFLDRIMAGNQELIGFLQRLAGYCCTGLTSEQVFVLLHGVGANGKSTFVETLKYVLGEYAAATEPATFLATKNDRIRNDLARLSGSRMVITSEPNAGRDLDEGTVKSLTGGDSVTARFLYKEHFEYLPKFKVLLSCNFRPVVKGCDEGIWRRLRLIPFEVTIPAEERDFKLGEKLRAEAEGILAWMIQGCLEWQKVGLVPPETVMTATADYRGEMDQLAEFITACCSLEPTGKVAFGPLYRSYKDYCLLNDQELMSERDFGARLTERGLISKSGAGNKKYRLGLVLKTTPSSPQPSDAAEPSGHMAAPSSRQGGNPEVPF